MIRWGVLAAAMIAPPAFAADLAPGLPAVTDAASAGIAAARQGEGYPVADHLLYAVRNARDIDPADGDVDAIVIATPLERTRHAAFVAEYSGRPVAAAEAYRAASLPPGHLAVIVYAHGANAEDRDFAARFGAAHLVFEDGSVASQTAETSEPSNAVYPLAREDRQRFVATIAYRFDLSGLRDPGRRRGRLAFVDASGKSFDLPFDLGKFK